jgi:hypothetical protein
MELNLHFRQACRACKRLLKSATNLVGDVEFLFLAPNTVREERTAAEWPVGGTPQAKF